MEIAVRAQGKRWLKVPLRRFQLLYQIRKAPGLRGQIGHGLGRLAHGFGGLLGHVVDLIGCLLAVLS